MKFTEEIKVRLERIFQDFKLIDPSSETKLDETKVYLIASKIDNCNDSFSSKDPSITLSIIWCSKFFEIFPAAT